MNTIRNYNNDQVCTKRSSVCGRNRSASTYYGTLCFITSSSSSFGDPEMATYSYRHSAKCGKLYGAKLCA